MIWVTVLCTLGSLPLADDASAQELEARLGSPVRVDDADGHSLDAFHAALARTARGEAKTRILQFGASHTAADIFTGRMRRSFQARYGDAGHGFFMPARPWKTYRHQDLVFENSRYKRWRWSWDFIRQVPCDDCRQDDILGLAGMSVSATSRRQWSRFRVSRDGTYGRSATRFELFYYKQPGGGDLYLKIDRGTRQRIRTRGQPGIGYFERELEDGFHEFEMKVRGNGEVRVFGATLERDHPGVIMDTLGINGARAASMLGWNYALWEELVRRREPALIILAYGTNESGDKDEPIRVYASNLRRVLKRVRTAAPNASCVLFGPTERPHVHRRRRRDPLPSFTARMRTTQIVETQRAVSKELGCGFWDAVAATGGQWSIVNWAHHTPRYAYSDYVHLTRRGYYLLADLFEDALLDGFEE